MTLEVHSGWSYTQKSRSEASLYLMINVYHTCLSAIYMSGYGLDCDVELDESPL
jgi:hypothetical protein